MTPDSVEDEFARDNRCTHEVAGKKSMKRREDKQKARKCSSLGPKGGSGWRSSFAFNQVREVENGVEPLK